MGKRETPPSPPTSRGYSDLDKLESRSNPSTCLSNFGLAENVSKHHPLPPLLVPQHSARPMLDLRPTEVSLFSSPLLLTPLITLGLYSLWIAFANRSDETLREAKHSPPRWRSSLQQNHLSDILDATRRDSSSSFGSSGSGSGIGKGGNLLEVLRRTHPQ